MSAEAINKETDILAKLSTIKAIKSFYFVKYPRYEDPELSLELAEAEEQVFKRNRTQIQLKGEVTINLAKQVNINSQLKDKKLEKNLKRNDEKSQQEKQEKLYSRYCANRDRGAALSKKENSNLLSSLLHRMPHGSKTLVEEKKLLRQVRDIYVRGEQNIESGKKKPPTQYRESRYWAYKYEGYGLYCLSSLDEYIKHLEGSLKAIKNYIRLLRKELAPLNALRAEAYDNLLRLRKQQERANVYYYENQSLFTKVKELAANKDISALEELSYTEVENFMSEWNRSNTFRNKYKA